MSEIDTLTREQRIDLLARLIASLLPQQTVEPAAKSDPELLDVNAAAALLSVTRQWVYRNGRNLKLAIDLSPGTVRYSRAAILMYVAQKSAAR